MKLHSVEVQGFRSFVAPQQLDFSLLAPGLYHVAGRNEVNPELGANAVGKSTLFKAVRWACFGSAGRGLRASAVKNWVSKEKCAVTLNVETASKMSEILRVWSPNTLEVMFDHPDCQDPSVVDQSQLENLLGLPPSAFDFAMYFAQYPAPAFVDLSPGEQTSIFTSILDLGLWERAADNSTSTVREIDSQMEMMRREQANLEGQAQELLAVDYSAEEKVWGKKHQELITVEHKEISKAERGIELVNAALQKSMEDGEKFRTARDRASDFSSSPLRGLDTRKAVLNQKLAMFQKKNVSVCPECGAPVSVDHIKKEIAKTKTALADLEKEEKVAQAEYAVLLKKVEELKPFEEKLLEVRGDLIRVQQRLESHEKELQKLSAEENPYTKMREAGEKRGQEIAQSLDRVEAELAAADKERASTQFWVKGFKEIRLSQIHSSLAQLTLECNEALFQLGLRDWQVEFQAERETKSGTVSRTFNTMIRAPGVKGAVPWETWCGGESQRLRLSVSMGFANLICSRLGVQPNVEFWDEPTTGLSDAGIEDLLQVLSERASRQEKILLLADHRALDHGGFTGTITIVKDKNGSRIEL